MASNTVTHYTHNSSYSTAALNPTNQLQDIVMEDELTATQPLESAPSTQVEHWQSIDCGAWGVLVPLDGKTPVIKLMQPTVYIGRGHNESLHPGQNIQLNHPNISRRHCSLQWNGKEDGDYRVEVYDDSSTNGTYIDNVKLKEAELIPGKNKRACRGWLVHGSVLSLGTSREAVPPEGYSDTRYLYKHLASAMRVSRTMDMIE